MSSTPISGAAASLRISRQETVVEDLLAEYESMTRWSASRTITRLTTGLEDLSAAAVMSR